MRFRVFVIAILTVAFSAGVKAAPPPGISERKTEIGTVLTDAAGFTLYEGGAAAAAPWHPVIAPWIAANKGDWTVLHHEDGTAQWAFHGKPLYRFDGDIRPGDINGNDAGNGFHAVVLEQPPPVPAWVTVAATDVGALYADGSGRTLYAYTGDKRSACDADCLHEFWQPVTAQPGAAPAGDWSVVGGPDGALQWAYRGRPLFTYVQDVHPGNIAGISFRSGKGFLPILRSGRTVQGQGN